MRKVYFALIFVSFYGCSVFNTIKQIPDLKYKIAAVKDFNIGGINISEKKSISDFSPIDLIKFTTKLAQSNVDITFNIMVEVITPGSKENSSGANNDFFVTSLPYRL